MIAQELMTEDPMTLTVSATVRQAMNVLQTLDIRHLPIVGEDNELVGMLSDRDMRAVRADFLDVRVSEIMSADVMSVGPTTDATEIIDMMIDTKVGALPVVDQTSGDLMGIISYVDILRRVRNVLADE